jgi:Nif-specific regulatory protein
MSSSPAAEWEEPAEAHAGEVRKLSTLLEASQALSATLDLKESLRRVLEILGRHHGAIRSTVVLLNENNGDVELEAASGAITAKRVRYRVGEGITGKVVQTGKPMVVPRVSREPTFLSRAAERPELPAQELTYISAPIALDSKTVGAIGIDLHFKAERDYNRTVKFLGVVGSMIAQAVKVHRLIQADKQRLVDENTHLRQELKERYDFSNLVGTSGPMHQVYEQMPRSPAPTRRFCCAANQAPAKSSLRTPFTTTRRGPRTVHQSQLRGAAAGSDRVGAVRLRKRRLYRRLRAEEGRFEAAKAARCFSDEIGDLNSPRRSSCWRVLQSANSNGSRHGNDSYQHPAGRGDNKDRGESHSRRRIPRGSLLPVERVRDLCPPLRDEADVLLPAGSFPEEVSRRAQQKRQRLRRRRSTCCPAITGRATCASWRNVIERAVVVCDSQVIHAHHLPPTLQTAEAPVPARPRRSRFARGVEKGCAAGRPQDRAGQPRQGGPAPVDDRADLQLSGAKVRNRLAPIQGVAARPL